MPRRVQGPDGTIHDFPNDATDDEIRTALGGGAKAIPSTGILKNYWEQVNPMGLVQTAADFVPREPKDLLISRPAREAWDTAKNLVLSGAEDIGAGDTATGIRKIISGIIPVIGPSLNKAGEQAQQGDYSGAIGTTLGVATNVAAPEIVKGAAVKAPGLIRSAGEAVSERLYQSALKPSTTLSPERAAGMVETGLRERIPVSPAGGEKIASLVDDLNTKIADTIQADPKRRVSGGRAISNTADVEQKFATQVNPEADVNAIGQSRAEFARQLAPDFTLSAEEAQTMKQGTYRQLKQRAYGELKGATVEAQKALARGLKEELVQQFPELDYLNTREGKLLQLEPALEKAVQRHANKVVLNMGGALTGGMVGALTGSRAAATTVGVVRSLLSYPTITSKLAIAINRGSKGAITISQAKARILGYANAFGQAVEGESSAPPASQATQ